MTISDEIRFQVMTRYISNPDNLKLMMNMLKEKSRNIQFEAFHVIKVTLKPWKGQNRYQQLSVKICNFVPV